MDRQQRFASCHDYRRRFRIHALPSQIFQERTFTILPTRFDRTGNRNVDHRPAPPPCMGHIQNSRHACLDRDLFSHWISWIRSLILDNRYTRTPEMVASYKACRNGHAHLLFDPLPILCVGDRVRSVIATRSQYRHRRSREIDALFIPYRLARRTREQGAYSIAHLKDRTQSGIRE